MADIRNISDAVARRQNRNGGRRPNIKEGDKNKNKKDTEKHAEESIEEETEQTDQTDKLRRIKRKVCVAIGILIFWLAILLLIAAGTGKISLFLDSLASSLEIFLAECVSLVVPLIGTIYSAVKKNQMATWSFALGICIVVAFILGINTIRLVSMEEAGGEPVGTKTVSVEQTSPPEQTSSPEETQKETVYEKKRYSLKDDPFIVEIEAYNGEEKGTIGEEEASVKRAELIQQDIEKERKIRKPREVPQSFWDNRDIADFQYATYLNQRERAGNVERKNILPEIKEDRLEDLEDAKRHRILADNQHEESGNQRLIALYCIDLCDEYLEDEDINSAQANLVEGAKWAVISIYNAALEGERDNMEKGYEALETVVERLEKMSGDIGGENIDDIKNCREAYRILLQNME